MSAGRARTPATTRRSSCATTRIRFKKSAKVYADKDIDGVVDWLYSKHRTGTLHGTNPDILHDWSDACGLAGVLVRLCLVACMNWVIQSPTESDPMQLLTQRDTDHADPEHRTGFPSSILAVNIAERCMGNLARVLAAAHDFAAVVETP